jgi:hypothetical protein
LSRDGIALTIATLAIIVATGAQGFLLYRIVLLDTGEQYLDIPLLIGINVLIYAAVLFIYLRLFIGVNAYKKVSDEHPR